MSYTIPTNTFEHMFHHRANIQILVHKYENGTERKRIITDYGNYFNIKYYNTNNEIEYEFKIKLNDKVYELDEQMLNIENTKWFISYSDHKLTKRAYLRHKKQIKKYKQLTKSYINEISKSINDELNKNEIIFESPQSKKIIDKSKYYDYENILVFTHTVDYINNEIRTKNFRNGKNRTWKIQNKKHKHIKASKIEIKTKKWKRNEDKLGKINC